MKTVLVVGASGFVGRRTAQLLHAGGYAVRCLARNPARVQDLETLGCEIVKGDISDLTSMNRALDSVQAVYIAIHTLSPQPASTADERFMAVEMNGLQNIVTACGAHGVRRLIYVTSLGIAADAQSEWLRQRWRAEQLLLHSGLDVTVIRPGMIVGAGGRGFGMLANGAKKPIAFGLGGLAHAMGEVIGQPVHAQAVPCEQWAASLQAFGMAPGATGLYEEMLDGFNSGWINFGVPGAEPVAGTTTPAQVFAQARKAQDRS